MHGVEDSIKLVWPHAIRLQRRDMQRIKRNLNAPLGNANLESKRYDTWRFYLFFVKFANNFISSCDTNIFFYLYMFYTSYIIEIESDWINICHLFTFMWALNQYSIALAVAWDMSSEWQRRAFIIVMRVCRSKFLRNRCRAVRKVNAAFRGRIESCRRAPSLLPSGKRHFH